MTAVLSPLKLEVGVSSPIERAELDWVTYSPSEVDQAMHLWRHLERRLHSTRFSCSPFWTHCWISHYGPVTPFRIVAARHAGEVRGMALITEGVGRTLGPFPMRTRHLGTSGEPQHESPFVEYNRFLVEPGFEHDFAAGVVRLLQNDVGWDQLHLDGFHASDLQPLLKHFPQATVQRRESRYTDLKQIRETVQGDILSQLGRSTRSNIRRRLRDYGHLDCAWARSVDEADAIFAELVLLHQARWEASGQPGAFASGRFRRFQHDVMVRGIIEHRVVLFRVQHSGQTVGCLMLLVDGNRLLDYLSGFASFDEKPSPGLITHFLCMEHALKKGYDAYDFLVGDKRHKENLSTQTTEICWATINRATLKMRAISTMQQVKQRFRKRRTSDTRVQGSKEAE